jgi:hypothetical protein
MKKQTTRKPLFNRKETQTLLTTLKMATTAGVLSLTIGGWSLLTQLETQTVLQANASQPSAVVAALTDSTVSTAEQVSSQANPVRQKNSLDIVQWVKDISGKPVAVVRDRRGSLWYVLGSDVTRLEQGQSPRVRPQLVKTTTRTRAS